MVKRILGIFIALTLVGPFGPSRAPAQTPDELKALQKEIEALKESHRKLEKEIEAIKKLVSERQVPTATQVQGVALSGDRSAFRGDKNAPVTLIEFSDYQCPFCARHFRETLPELERDYIKTSKIKYVFRDFPIASLHPAAFKAHEAANCAGEQGKYWEMHDRLFSNQKAQSSQDLPLHAQALGLDMSVFQQCLESGRHAAKIREDVAEGRRAGVRGTPTFFLGLTQPNDSKVKALRVIRGAYPYSTFQQAIDSLLSSPAE